MTDYGYFFGGDFFISISSEVDDIMHGEDDYPGGGDVFFGSMDTFGHGPGPSGYPALHYTTKLWYTLTGDGEDIDVKMYSIWASEFFFLGVGGSDEYQGPPSGLPNPWVSQWDPPPGAVNLIGFVKRVAGPNWVWGTPYTQDTGADQFEIIAGVEADPIKLPKPEAKAGRALGGARRKREHIVGT